MKEFTIKIDERDLGIIVTALSEKPFQQVANIMYKLEHQVKEQEQLQRAEPIIGPKKEDKLFDDPDV